MTQNSFKIQGKFYRLTPPEAVAFSILPHSHAQLGVLYYIHTNDLYNQEIEINPQEDGVLGHDPLSMEEPLRWTGFPACCKWRHGKDSPILSACRPKSAGGYSSKDTWGWSFPVTSNEIARKLIRIEQEAREQGSRSSGEGSDGDSTPHLREPLVRSGGLRPMFRSAPRQESGVISPRSEPPAPCLFVENLISGAFLQISEEGVAQ